MKCSACGRDSDEGFSYCPWCGSSATTTQEAGNLRRIAVQERLRELRSNMRLSYIGATICFVVGGLGVLLGLMNPELGPYPAWVKWMLALLIVYGCVGFGMGVWYYGKWQDLVRKLEKGRFE